jgi:hypothetical protein
MLDNLVVNTASGREGPCVTSTGELQHSPGAGRYGPGMQKMARWTRREPGRGPQAEAWRLGTSAIADGEKLSRDMCDALLCPRPLAGPFCRDDKHTSLIAELSPSLDEAIDPARQSCRVARLLRMCPGSHCCPLESADRSFQGKAHRPQGTQDCSAGCPLSGFVCAQDSV